MIVNYKIYHIRVYDQKSYEITCDLIRAFAFGIANAICKRILALMHQTSPASGLANTNYCKKLCNSAIVQF